MEVILLNFGLKIQDSSSGPLEAFGGSDDADIVPHGPSKFIPVVRNDHQFVGVGKVSVFPSREGRLAWFERICLEVFCRSVGDDQCFQK